MKVISFELKAPFAFYKDKTGVSFNITYKSITPTIIKGILGAIEGLSGFKEIKEKNKVEFIEKYQDIKIGIELLNENFNLTYIKFNESTKMNITGEKNRVFNTSYSVLNNIRYKIYLYLDVNKHNKLVNFILNEKSTYPIFLGKNEFSTTIINPKEEDYSLLKEVTFIHSLVPKEYTNYANYFDDINEEPDVYNQKIFFSIPISSDYKTGEYNRFEKVTYNSIVNIEKPKEKDIIIGLKNKNIYFFG